MIEAILGVGSSLIDKLFPDPIKNAEAKAKLLQMQQSGELAKIEAQQNMIIAEASSADKWTSRARPSFLYVMYFLFMACFIGAIISVWYPLEVKQAAENLSLLFNGLPQELYILFGSGYLGYGYYRTREKEKGVAK